ncbi:MAG: citrate/2-methylcitrate synthase [Candidatus Dojkabacteria bacterium]
MINIAKLRETELRIVAIGSYPQAIQVMLDFDYLLGKTEPSLIGIVSADKKQHKAFWGDKEIMIPVNIDPKAFSGNAFITLVSGRRAYSATKNYLESAKNKQLVGHIFAEDVPEQHSLALYREYPEVLIAGTAGVGLLIPGYLKLGVIVGTQPEQILRGKALSKGGKVAVISASGGMTNEIVTQITAAGGGVSFALCVGGDRFPQLSLVEAFKLAQADPQTEAVTYYGELGGEEEYELIELIRSGEFDKEFYAHISGVVDAAFSQATQFGHAKALARTKDESAAAKVEAMKAAGLSATSSFAEYNATLKKLAAKYPLKEEQDFSAKLKVMSQRKSQLFSTTISSESEEDGYLLLGKSMQTWAAEESLGKLVISALLGKQIESDKLAQLVEVSIKLLADHGHRVSGAVNTMITARAGKDISSAVASGILTIGPRFGGAITGAASHWLAGGNSAVDPKEFVENLASKGERIQGIGHRKYSLQKPDPRVKHLKDHFMNKDLTHRYLNFALAVEQVTLTKKPNLILNVDGLLAALLLDYLSEYESISESEIQELAKIDFFNAIFIISRTIGFSAHYLDQRRLDAGLFRLVD